MITETSDGLSALAITSTAGSGKSHIVAVVYNKLKEGLDNGTGVYVAPLSYI